MNKNIKYSEHNGVDLGKINNKNDSLYGFLNGQGGNCRTDAQLLMCFAIKKCRELQRKIQNVATRYFPYFLDNAFVKRKLWPVYEIIWAW